jgi:phytoene/squalene synthetase
LDIEQPSSKNLATSITSAASKQTYYTLRFLADRDRVQHANQAYAYFRWVDDCLDDVLPSRTRRLSFLARQQSLLTELISGQEVGRLEAEECMLAELIESDSNPESGLGIYIRHMMEVMAFDAQRRGQPVSAAELDGYTRNLASAVTEYMHYFIGHGSRSPHDHTRYAAVTAAHVAHMLRDTQDDVQAGYFNIPREVLSAGGIRPDQTDHPAYRAWVRRRVGFARQQFKLAYQYMARVQSLRCRFAGHMYMSRFTSMLSLIERDQYLLRMEYPKRRTLSGAMTFLGSLHASFFREPNPQQVSIRVSARESNNHP